MAFRLKSELGGAGRTLYVWFHWVKVKGPCAEVGDEKKLPLITSPSVGLSWAASKTGILKTLKGA